MLSAYVNFGWLVSLKWILRTWSFLQNKTKSTEIPMQHICRAKKVGQIFSVWTSTTIQPTEEIPKVKKCHVADSVNKWSMLVVHLLGVDKQSEQFTDVPGNCCWFSEQNWVRDLIRSVEQQWRPICCSCVSSNLVDLWSWWRIGVTMRSIQPTQSSASRWLLGAGLVWHPVRTRPWWESASAGSSTTCVQKVSAGRLSLRQHSEIR